MTVWAYRNMKLKIKSINPFWYALVLGLILNCVIIPILVTVFVVNKRNAEELERNNQTHTFELLVSTYNKNYDLYSIYYNNDDDDSDDTFEKIMVVQQKTMSTSEIIDKIYKVQANKNFTRDDAVSLFYKIQFYASRYGLSLREALTIVNVESDFTINAYNSRGKAYGLCQITQSCLAEWNKYHPNNMYSISQVLDVDINLNIGFWYYNQILTKYADRYNYITTTSLEKSIRDAYIAYNVGPSIFNSIGIEGRNCLRNGIYPISMYGCKKGSTYKPIFRLYEVLDDWKEVAS